MRFLTPANGSSCEYSVSPGPCLLSRSWSSMSAVLPEPPEDAAPLGLALPLCGLLDRSGLHVRAGERHERLPGICVAARQDDRVRLVDGPGDVAVARHAHVGG